MAKKTRGQKWLESQPVEGLYIAPENVAQIIDSVHAEAVSETIAAMAKHWLSQPSDTFRRYLAAKLFAQYRDQHPIARPSEWATTAVEAADALIAALDRKPAGTPAEGKP